MLVECIENKYAETYLTIGKKYKVIIESENFYTVEIDTGVVFPINKSRFRLLK